MKLRVPDRAEAAERIEARGFQLLRARVFESNELFDTPDQRLRARGELIRVRTAGELTFLTFKSADLAGSHKRREELETRIDDAQVIRGILERLGMQVLFRYEKYRTEFRRGDEPGIITIDETPIGTYMELEGDPAWIDEVAAELGFSRADYILASYGRLYLEYCEGQGRIPSHMIFAHGMS